MAVIDLSENIAVAIILGITFIAMGILSIKIIIDDFKKMKLEWLKTILLGVIPLLSVTIIRIILGYQWYYILIFPAYILLMVLNELFNNNKFIGKGDMDVFSASLALLVPVIMNISTGTYDMPQGGEDITGNIIAVHIQGAILSFLEFLIIGYVIAIIQTFIRRFVIKRQLKKKESKSLVEDKNYKGILNKKVPVAIAYIPVLFYMTYLAATIMY